MGQRQREQVQRGCAVGTVVLLAWLCRVLPLEGLPSGLREAMRVLKKVEGIGICELTNADVVRHVMVQRIVKAYEEYETAKNGGKGKK